MLLAIDVGNTNICFAIYDGENQIKQWRVETDHFFKIPALENIDSLEAIIVCSVVPDINGVLMKECAEHYFKAPTFITLENIDITIDIDRPEQMGADRLVAASAACALYQSPTVIVDFGTATTFDVLDGNNTHKGGVIAPGINLSLSALEQAAAQLPDIAIEKPDKVIGRTTKEAMQSGVYWGYISMIEGVLKRIHEEMKAKPFIIATGGLAPLFAQGTDIFDITDQDLIMRGLVHMHNHIKNGKK